MAFPDENFKLKHDVPGLLSMVRNRQDNSRLGLLMGVVKSKKLGIKFKVKV